MSETVTISVTGGIQAIKREYYFIADLGFVFIPNSFMEVSNFRAHSASNIPAQEISLKVVDEGIIISTVIDDESFYHDIPEERASLHSFTNEQGQTVTEKRFGKIYPVISELGRFVLSQTLREEAGMSEHELIELCLMDRDTILIRKVVSR